MVTKSGEYYYSQTVNEQYDPNIHKDVTHWKNMVNANGDDKRTWAMCYYSKEGNKQNGKVLTPCEITAHDFQLDIPKNAFVKSVTIEMSLKVANPVLQVEAPYVIFNIYDSKVTIPSQTQWGETGWVWGGTDYAVSLKERLSTSEKVFTYTFPESELTKKKFPATAFNQSIMGVDVQFKQPISFDGTNVAVYLNWVRIKVDYELPKTYLRWGSKMVDELNPYELQLDHSYRIPLMYGNKSKASAGHDQIVDIQLPFGVHLERYEVADKFGDTNRLVTVDEFLGKYKWNVDGGIGAENFINLFVHTDTVGLQKFIATNQGIDVNGYAYTHGYDGDYGTAYISSGTIQQNTISCFNFKSKVISSDNTTTYTVTVDGMQQADSSKISQTFKDTYNNHNGTGNYLVAWTLSGASQSNGVSIDESATDNNSIRFNIPKNTEVEIEWTGCFIVVTDGANRLDLVDVDNNQTYTYDYNAYPFDGVNAKFVMEDIVWYDHRLLTEVIGFDTGGLIVPFASKDTDRYMVEGDCNFNLHIQKPIAYIGCVPLTHSHHDPKSDFTNKSVKETYKSKIYMGKTGEIDENITYELHLPPKDWTTLQGLAELDRPVPTNAVPTAFEGDILNHRGWVELNGVKNVQKTNPLYYRGELDVDYLTHNINTRFQISKGVPVSDYSTDTLKQLLDYVVESGDEFADYTYTNTNGNIVHNRTGYFNVESDGNYIFDENQVPNRRTLMTMDNGQSIHIESVDAISESAKISFEWYATKILEDRENNIDRTIRLVDDNGLTILEYKYYDYDFDTRKDRYSCRVNCSILNKSIGAYDIVIDRDMYLGNDIESLNLTKDVDGNIVQENEPTDFDMMEETSRTYYDPITQSDVEIDSDPFIYNDFMYGSKLHFEISGNVLNIIDEGFSGKEISYSSITLEKGNYKFIVDFHNNNTDGDTNDVLHFFDFIVQESILSSDYKQLYSDMVVSSFPIPNRTLLYTRTSEEGLLYFYKNDGSAFTFIQEPYYMYYNGVDLKSREGISLFNLNNSYTIFYLQNGLVRVGFNRINGQIYLYKYDTVSQSYVRVAQFQLKEYTDFNLGHYSDDKIEVTVGKTVFIMYRGYPYIVIKHSTDDIDITTTYNQAYAEGVNGVNTDFPVLWDLINSDNLLPHCLTDDDINTSCIDVSTVYNEDVNTIPTLTLQKISPATVKNGDTIIFSISGTVANIDEEINIEDDFVGAFGEYSCETVVNENNPFLLTVTSSLGSAIQTNDNTELLATLVDYDYKGIDGATVHFYEIYEPYTFIVKSDKNTIQTGEYAEISAVFKDEDGSGVREQRVDFYEVYEPTDLIVKSSPQVIQSGGYTDITATLKDEDGSLIRDERVDFEVDVDSTNWSMTISDDEIIQTGDTVDITATVKDGSNNPVENIYVRFYEEMEDN